MSSDGKSAILHYRVRDNCFIHEVAHPDEFVARDHKRFGRDVPVVITPMPLVDEFFFEAQAADSVLREVELAGMSRPMMTFSFSPRRWSTLPLTADSVKTLVSPGRRRRTGRCRVEGRPGNAQEHRCARWRVRHPRPGPSAFRLLIEHGGNPVVGSRSCLRDRQSPRCGASERLSTRCACCGSGLPESDIPSAPRQ